MTITGSRQADLSNNHSQIQMCGARDRNRTRGRARARLLIRLAESLKGVFQCFGNLVGSATFNFPALHHVNQLAVLE